MDDLIVQAMFDEDYFERGACLGISGYENYRWMPEMSLRMAHFMVTDLPIQSHETVLDFGCAKGFLVWALRLLDIQAFGVDISQYAISQAPEQVRTWLKHIESLNACDFDSMRYDLVIAKDVLEHLSQEDIYIFLANIKTKRLFIVVPLANTDGRFIVPEYETDITHITRQPLSWWKCVFEDHGWKVKETMKTFRGCKENWMHYPDGNAFFLLESI